MITGHTNFTNCWALRHEALNIGGKRNKMIGRGTFARIYESARPDRVLKVTIDKFAHMLHTDAVAKPTGKHFPKVYKDYGVIGRDGGGREIYMVEIEKLYPTRSWSEYDKLPSKVHAKVEEFIGLMGGSRVCINDLHFKNVMKRSDGTLVASDPVADNVILDGPKAFNTYRNPWWL